MKANKRSEVCGSGWIKAVAVTPLLACSMSIAFAQAVPPTVPPEAATEYAAVLKRVQLGDTTVNFRKFRIDGALVAGDRGMVGAGRERADRATFKKPQLLLPPIGLSTGTTPTSSITRMP
jgi:hypothetical protein